MASSKKRLYRSVNDRLLAGVAGGLAERTGLDPSIVRIAWVLLTVASAGLLILPYLLMAVVVPPVDDAVLPGSAIARQRSAGAGLLLVLDVVISIYMLAALSLAFGSTAPGAKEFATWAVVGWLAGLGVGYIVRRGLIVPFLIGLGVLAIGLIGAALSAGDPTQPRNPALENLTGFAIWMLPGLGLVPLIASVRRSRADRQGEPSSQSVPTWREPDS